MQCVSTTLRTSILGLAMHQTAIFGGLRRENLAMPNPPSKGVQIFPSMGGFGTYSTFYNICTPVGALDLALRGGTRPYCVLVCHNYCMCMLIIQLSACSTTAETPKHTSEYSKTSGRVRKHIQHSIQPSSSKMTFLLLQFFPCCRRVVVGARRLCPGWPWLLVGPGLVWVMHLTFWDSLHYLQEREKHFGTFSVLVRFTVLKLSSLEKKKESKINDGFRFFQTLFSWIKWISAEISGHFEYEYVLWLQLSLIEAAFTIVLRSLLPYSQNTSTTIEIATMISDTMLACNRP